jgi:CheY-like chemotaxis protein
MHILVVDDEADVQPLFTQRFRREIRSGAITFSFALSGEEALTLLHREASDVVLILSDINMPGMTGFELLRVIRDEHPAPSLPHVMMLTAYGNAETQEQALALGADDLLSKPVDFTALRERLAAFFPETAS